MASADISLGDLTPMNILLKECEGRIVAKLTDFGLSKTNISRHSGTKAGTPAYKCPEYGSDEVCDAVDMFSFGGVLVYLFGEEHAHPFEGKDDDEIHRMMVACHQHNVALNIPELETIREQKIREIAAECLNADAGLRPSAGDLLDRFSELCELSKEIQKDNAAEDAVFTIGMRSFNVVQEEMKSLQEKEKKIMQE